MRPLLLGVAFALALGARAVAGDRDVAELLYQKGLKASREKNFTEAESCFRRAIAEFSPYPDAVFAHGEALEKLGRAAEACVAYRRCLDEIRASPPPASKWKTLAGKAEKAVARLDKATDDLTRLDREFIDACLALARSCGDKSPPTARGACEAVLALEPANSAAKACLAGLGGGGGGAAEAGWIDLCGEDGLSEWDPGESAEWSCEDGVITGVAEARLGQLNWRDDHVLKGRYTLTATFRIVQEQQSALFGLFFGARDLMRTRTGFILTSRSVLDLAETIDERTTLVRNFVPKTFDRKARHTMRVEVEPGRVRCLLDGVEAFSHVAKESSAFDGSPGIFVQGGRIEIRDVRLRR